MAAGMVQPCVTDAGEDYGPLGAQSPQPGANRRQRSINEVPLPTKVPQKDGSRARSQAKMRASMPYHFSLVKGAPSFLGKTGDLSRNTLNPLFHSVQNSLNRLDSKAAFEAYLHE